AEQVGDAGRHRSDHALAPGRAEHDEGERGLEGEGGTDDAQPDPAAVRGEEQRDGEDQRDPAQPDYILHMPSPRILLVFSTIADPAGITRPFSARPRRSPRRAGRSQRRYHPPPAFARAALAR